MSGKLIYVKKWQTVVVSFFYFSFPRMFCFAYHSVLSSFQLYFVSCVLCLMSHRLVGYLSYLECWVLIVDWALFYVRIVQFYFFSYLWFQRDVAKWRNIHATCHLSPIFGFFFVSFSFFFIHRQRIGKFTMVIRNSSSICHCLFDCLCFFVAKPKKKMNKNEIQDDDFDVFHFARAYVCIFDSFIPIYSYWAHRVFLYFNTVS